jgi:hypothetical protein
MGLHPLQYRLEKSDRQPRTEPIAILWVIGPKKIDHQVALLRNVSHSRENPVS